ncbi:hypothetical protein FACS1894122_10720 [Alphaproteobacteria bacterium]|nr:hypothetical protein FACS1894122_10720 [Alphaproteobacteria bacterium]
MNLENVGTLVSEFFGMVVEPQEKSLVQLGETYHLSDFLPYKWYDTESELFISDNNLGFMLETAPLVGNSESMQKELSNIFTQILPEDSSIQTMIFADKNIGGLLKQYIRSRDNSSETMQSLAMRRSEFLSKLAIKSPLSPYVLRDFKCYMSVTLNLDMPVDLAIKKVREIKKQILATLSIVGVANRVMNADDLVKFLDGIFNSDFESTSLPSRKWNRYDAISDQVIAHDTDIIVEDDLLKLRREQTEINYDLLKQEVC